MVNAYENITGWADTVKIINEQTSGVFGLSFLIGLYVIFFALFSRRYPTGQAMAGAGAIVASLSFIMVKMNWVPPYASGIMVVVAIVSIVIMARG